MAYQVNVPQGPDIWSGYHRSLEGIGQGIGSGVAAYLAEKKKKEEAEKARQRVIKLLTERKEVVGDVLSNPPLNVSEGRQGIQTGTIADRYMQGADLKPARGLKTVESVPDIPAGLDKESYDALSIGAMNRKLLKPWENEDRQTKIADEKALLDYRAKLERDKMEHEAGLDRSQLYGDPTKVTLSDQVRGNIQGFEKALPSIQGAQEDPGFLDRGLQNIVAGGGVAAYQEPEYKDRDVFKGGKWQKEASIDGGNTWQPVGGAYDKTDSAATKTENAWGDDYFATLKSVAKKGMDGIEDPQYNIALQLGDKYKNLNPREAAISAYREAGNISKAVDYLTENPDTGLAGLKGAGWKENDIKMVAKLAGVAYAPAVNASQVQGQSPVTIEDVLAEKRRRAATRGATGGTQPATQPATPIKKRDSLDRGSPVYMVNKDGSLGGQTWRPVAGQTYIKPVKVKNTGMLFEDTAYQKVKFIGYEGNEPKFENVGSPIYDKKKVR